jgi:hypothetical protein
MQTGLPCLRKTVENSSDCKSYPRCIGPQNYGASVPQNGSFGRCIGPPINRKRIVFL